MTEKTMKQVLPYIIIIFALLIAGGIYLQAHHTASLTPTIQNNQPAEGKIKLGGYGPAPEFAGINHWLNSQPLTLADLKGKVVLVDFWTYSCINCIRTLPYITKWYDTYK